MHHHTELSFVGEFRWVSPLHYLKNGWQNAVLLWCMLQGGRHLYTTTAPSCCIPASYCHLSATLQTISITVVNLQDNRAVIRIFIALSRFSFGSFSYLGGSLKSPNIFILLRPVMFYRVILSSHNTYYAFTIFCDKTSCSLVATFETTHLYIPIKPTQPQTELIFVDHPVGYDAILRILKWSHYFWITLCYVALLIRL